MADTIEIIQGTATTIEIAGLQGPQGPQGATGSGLGTLTTQGDTLYQGASSAQRLPIGTAGQILKVNSGGTAPEWGAAPASGVSSVAGRTGDVTLAVADVSGAVASTDARLTDARTPLSHAHGNLTNSGAIGTTANLPLKTGTNGVVEAGAFGTAAGQFAEGNDARLSNNVRSITTGITGADAVTNIVSLTQAEYNAIGSPDAATLYLITDP